MKSETAPEVIYLYGFVRSDAPLPTSGMTGVEGGPVERLPLDGFDAVLSPIPGELYSEEALAERVRDLAWIGPRGLDHERIVTWHVDRGGILPASLLTLYSSRQELSRRAAEEAGRIRDQLERVAGLREWELKVSFDPERLDQHLGSRSEEIQAFDREILEAAPGRRYLLERRRATVASRLMEDVAGTLARELLERVRNLCEAVKSIPVPRGIEGASVVFRAALLVRAENEEILRRRLEEEREEMAGRGVDILFAGPWAPYRFLGDESAQDPGDEMR